MNPAKWVLRAVAVTAVVVAPWIHGGVSHSVHCVLACTALLILVGALLLRLLGVDQRKNDVRMSMWWFLLPFIPLLVQLFPFPDSVGRIFSPTAAAFRDEFQVNGTPSAWPITLCPFETRRLLSLYWMAASFMFVAATLFETRKARLVAFTVITANGAVLASVGILGRFGVSWEPVYSAIGTGFVPFVNQNNAAGYLCASASAAVALCWRYTREHSLYRSTLDSSRSVAMAIVLATGTVTIFAGIFFTYCRGSYVAILAIAFAAFLWLANRRSLRGLMVLTVLGLATVGVAWWSGTIEPIVKRAQLISPSELQGGLVLHWKDDLSIVPDFWSCGVGVGAYRYLNRSYQTIVTDQWYMYSENQYLQILCSGGILSLGILIVLIVASLQFAYMLLCTSDDRQELGVLGLFLVVNQATTAFFDFALFHPSNLVLLAFLLGLLFTSQSDVVYTGSESKSDRLGIIRHIAPLFLLFLGVFAVHEAIAHARVESAMDGYAYDVDVDESVFDSVDEVSSQIDSLANAIVHCPDHAAGLAMLSNLHVQRFRLRTAEELKAEYPDSNVEELKQATQLENLAARMNRLKQASPDLFRDLTTHGAMQDISQAIKLLEKSNASCPLLPRVHFRTAVLSHLSDSKPNSLDGVASSLRLAPSNPNLHIGAGAFALLTEHPEQAAVWIGSGLQLGAIIDQPLASIIWNSWSGTDFTSQVMGNDIETAWRVATSHLATGTEWRNALAAHVLELSERPTPSSDVQSVPKDCYAAGAYELLDAAETSAKIYQTVFSRDNSAELTSWRYRYVRVLLKLKNFDEAFRQIEVCCQQSPTNPYYQHDRKLLADRLKGSAK